MAKKTSDHLEPVNLVVRRFKDHAQMSERDLAYELRLAPTAVAKWVYRGAIPRRNGINYDAQLLELAKKKKVPLTTHEIIYGGTP